MSEEVEQKKMDVILSAIPWRCFHCDFITNDEEEARAHFGDCDDASDFTPLCKWWSNMDDQERKEQFQVLLQELNSERDDNMKLRDENEALEYKVHSQESAIKSYKPFRECRSINEIFCLYDSMEGRVLAAEERERVLVEAVNDSGFKVMLTDDGKTFLKLDVAQIGVPQG